MCSYLDPEVTGPEPRLEERHLAGDVAAAAAVVDDLRGQPEAGRRVVEGFLVVLLWPEAG